ncbi:MAG: hypothetical protein AB1467_05755 [Candidatus Diapherotrites archaeon]
MNKVFLALCILTLTQLIGTASALSVTISINSGAQYTNNNTVTLTLTSDDQSVNCDYANDSNSNYSGSPTPFTATKSWTLSAGDGAKTVYYKCTDVNLNTAEANNSITLDTSAPTVNILQPNGATTSNTVSFDLNETGSEINLSTVTVLLNGAESSFNSSNCTLDGGLNYHCSYTETKIDKNGNYTIDVNAQDNAGNLGTATSTFTYTDSTPPSAPTNFTATGGHLQISLNWTANTEYDLNGYNIYFSTTQNFDTNAQTLLIFTTSNSYPHIYLQASTTYYYKIKAKDKTGNESTASNANATTNAPDGTAPTTAYSGPDDAWHNSNASITLTCSDTGGAGCKLISYRINSGSWNYVSGPSSAFTISNEADNLLEFYSTDNSDNNESMQSKHVKIDKTVPKPSLTATGYSSRIELTWSAITDSLSGLKEYFVKKNDEAWISNARSTTYNFAGLTNGTLYNFKLKVVDNAGNETESDPVSATPTSSSTSGSSGGGSSDTTAPNLSWTFPADANYELKDYNITLKVNASDYDSGLAIIILSYRKTDQNTYTRITNITEPTNGTNSYKWELSSDMNSGTHELKAVARDEAGNIATKTITIKITLPAAVNPAKPADQNKVEDKNKTTGTEDKNKSKETVGTAVGTENQLEGTAGKGEETTNPFTGLASGLMKNIIPVIGIIVVLVVIAFVAVKAKNRVGRLGRDDLVGVNARIETGFHGISSKPSPPGSKTLEIIKREIEAEHTGKFARK